MKEKKIRLNLEGVNAKVVHYIYEDFKLNTLLLSFAEKRRILSTMEGIREVNLVGNIYVHGDLSERIMIKFGKQIPVDFQFELVKNLLALTENSHEKSAFLSTAVNMKHLAVCEKSCKEYKVCCVATAGVKGNALRMGVDRAGWVESNGTYDKILGTINIILLTNAKLTDGEMVRAVITATEAKTAVLQHFDVRSTLTPENQATGTGTDNVIIVSGPETGDHQCIKGHVEIYELIAVSTKIAVTKALIKHNRLISLRALIWH